MSPTTEHPGPSLLALEGVPGSGKTTLFAALVRARADQCVFFTEPNPVLAERAAPDQEDAPPDDSLASLTLWYLRHEVARLHAARTATAPLALLDRNHLGVLAYCYATRGPDTMPYATAREHYLRDVDSALPTDARTVILLATPSTSLKRRGDHPEHPRWEQWFDKGLLERLHDFYRDHAAELCPTPPLVIDTENRDPSQVWAVFAESAVDLGLPAAPQVAVTPSAIDPVFIEPYRATGGLEMLGHPVGPAFSYRNGLVQLFQLGALRQDTTGRTGIWNPAAPWQSAS